MKQTKVFSRFYFPIGYYFLWVLLAGLDRLFFFFARSTGFSFSAWRDFFTAYFYGVKLDLSLAAYVCALPFLVYGFVFLLSKIRLSLLPLKIYTYLVAFVYSLISAVNVSIYKEWGMKVSNRLMETFLETPAATLASTDISHWFLGVLLFVLLFGFVIFAWRFLVRYTFKNQVEIKPF